MIAGCAERVRARSCGTCERRDACASLWPEVFAPSRSIGSPRHPLLAMIEAIAARIERRMPERAGRTASTRRAVERCIEARLADGPVRIEAVARALGCGRQTLYRRLKAEGVTFEQVLDELRSRLALRFVRRDRLSVKDAAYRLGFSDPAAFSRAFKRWTGMSPRDARERKPN